MHTARRLTSRFDVEPDLDLTEPTLRLPDADSLPAAVPERLLHRRRRRPPDRTARRTSTPSRCRPTRAASTSTRPSGTATTASVPGSRSCSSFPGSTSRGRGARADHRRRAARSARLADRRWSTPTTGERWPYLAEIDVEAPDDASRTLIIRPAVNFLGATATSSRCATRDASRRADRAEPRVRGLPRRHRDHRARPSRRGGPRWSACSPTLHRAGVAARRAHARVGLHRSPARESLAGRMLHIRDDAFAALGDAAPAFTVDTVEDEPRPARAAARITGTFQVPLLPDRRRRAGRALRVRRRRPADRAAGTTHRALSRASSRRRRRGTPGARRRCTATACSAATARWTRRSCSTWRVRHNIVYCATNWIGMAEDDVGNAVAILQDLSQVPDPRRPLAAGLLELPVPRPADDPRRRLRVRTPRSRSAARRSSTDGAVLRRQQPGRDHRRRARPRSRRTSPVGARRGRHELLDAAAAQRRLRRLQARSSTPPTPTSTTGSSAISSIQMLWDRGEANGYAQHLTTDPYPNTPRAQGPALGAVGDHQVIADELRDRGAHDRRRVARARSSRPGGRTTCDDRAGGSRRSRTIRSRARRTSLWDTGSPLSPSATRRHARATIRTTTRRDSPRCSDLKDAFWRRTRSSTCATAALPRRAVLANERRLFGPADEQDDADHRTHEPEAQDHRRPRRGGLR